MSIIVKWINKLCYSHMTEYYYKEKKEWTTATCKNMGESSIHND